MKPLLILVAGLLHAQPPPADLVTERDLTYLTPRAQAPSLKMDILKPRGAGPFPVVLLIHGGAFSGGSPRDMDSVAKELAQLGFASATISYRLTPRFQFPGQVQDVKAAVRFLRANASKYGLDTSRVCAWGEEAGGTLALFLAVTRNVTRFEGRAEYREHSSSVDCVVNRGGSPDLLHSAAPGLAAFVGSDAATSKADFIEASPFHWVTAGAAPVLSVGAGAELEAFAKRLQAAGVEARVSPSPAAAFDFLKRHLKPAADRFTLLLSDHGPGAELIAIGWPSGRVKWKVPNGTGLDVHALPNGHALFTNHQAKRVVEIDGNQKEVWSIGPEAGLVTPYSVRRLDNGNTLIGDASGARYTEFTKQGTVAWKWERADMADLWPRMARPTGSGTTLITFQKGGVVFEVDRAGKTIWEYRISGERLPYQAVRLANGNTLIGLVDPGEVIEVSPQGKVVRSIGGSNGALRFSWLAGIDVLPDGGMMIADFTSRRVVEVDAAGKLVHELRDLPWNVASIAVVPGR